MPIRQYLNGERFDFETMRVLGVALEVARAALRAEERGDRTDPIIAKHIIELPRPVPPCSSGLLRPKPVRERSLRHSRSERSAAFFPILITLGAWRHPHSRVARSRSSACWWTARRCSRSSKSITSGVAK